MIKRARIAAEASQIWTPLRSSINVHLPFANVAEFDAPPQQTSPAEVYGWKLLISDFIVKHYVIAIVDVFSFRLGSSLTSEASLSSIRRRDQSENI